MRKVVGKFLVPLSRGTLAFPAVSRVARDLKDAAKNCTLDSLETRSRSVVEPREFARNPSTLRAIVRVVRVLIDLDLRRFNGDTETDVGALR